MTKLLTPCNNQATFQEDAVLYFAYGSNLWLAQMQQRCPDHRVIGTGCLQGYRWIITSRGYASIVVSPEDQVLGVVYELSGADEQNLDFYEGVAQGSYCKQQVSLLVNGTNMDCMTYIDPVTDQGKPHPEYINRINRGIQDAGLPDQYVIRYLRYFIPAKLSLP